MKTATIIFALAMSAASFAAEPVKSAAAPAQTAAPAASTGAVASAKVASATMTKAEARKACAAEHTKNLAKCVSEKMGKTQVH